MLPVAEVRQIMHAHLERGDFDFREIRDEVAGRLAAVTEPSAAFLVAADKLLSLAVATERDKDGERSAFPDRDTEGRRIIVHTDYTTDPNVLRKTGLRKISKGKREIKEGHQLVARAEQIEMSFLIAA
jgi:hypothetical protein